MKVDIILVRERNRENGGGASSYPVSSNTLTLMWCQGGKGAKKEERECDKEIILKSMVVQSEKKVFFIRS